MPRAAAIAVAIVGIVALVRASQGATAASGAQLTPTPSAPTASEIAAAPAASPTLAPTPDSTPTQEPTPASSFPLVTPRILVPTPQPGAVFTHGDPSEPYVYISIDDCRNWANIEKDLETARDKNVHITLFPAGKYIDAHPEEAAAALRKAVAYNDEIGNHTYSHNLIDPSADKGYYGDLYAQIYSVRQALKDPNYREWFVRTPYGSGLSNHFFMDAAVKMDLAVALWSIDTGGYQNGSTLRSVMKNVFDTGHFRNGAIILMHDDDTDTAALPLIIDTILARGMKVGGDLSNMLIDRSAKAATDDGRRTAATTDAELVMAREDYPPPA
jgi:peptidoglycan/xylan/chitin deacetylase (PgdA/CDA1 family)